MRTPFSQAGYSGKTKSVEGFDASLISDIDSVDDSSVHGLDDDDLRTEALPEMGKGDHYNIGEKSPDQYGSNLRTLQVKAGSENAMLGREAEQIAIIVELGLVS